ncbi:hypothetical protein F5I97DRAFT_1923997 [Phlebopus sp. FC_14]|nr:hypothetical protein F5I97DRAFT_1923997 [Phlebopus sp. FC_14]
MSSRIDHRRRERSWEREDRDRERDRYSRASRSGTHRESVRRRDSRSPSPRRDRYDHDRNRDKERDYKGSRRDDRRDYDLDDRRRHAKRDERRSERRMDRRDRDAQERGILRDQDTRGKDSTASRHREEPSDGEHAPGRMHSPPTQPATAASSLKLDKDAVSEEGEEMDATNDDADAMMAMMGLTGFSSTKGKHVEGNQEGTVNVKKVRTWRQYMNR